MLKALIIDKLTRLGEKFEVNGDWVKCKCQHPGQNHSHDTLSAGINIDTGIHSCFKDTSHNFPFVTLDDTSDESEEDMIWRAKYANLHEDEPDEVLWESMTQPPMGHPVQEDWRGISKDLLQELGVYYCNRGRYQGRYIFGMWKDGTSVGFDSRMVDATAKAQQAKWLRPKGMKSASILYPAGKIQDMGSTHLVITEGVMDAVSYIQMGIAAIPAFGVAPPSPARIEQMLALGVMEVTIAYDNDEAGRAGALNVLPHYSKWFDIVDHPMVAMVRNSSYKDVNEFLVGIKANGLEKKEQGWDNGDI